MAVTSSSAISQPDYFAGEFLAASDYADEQAHQIAIQRAGSAALNSAGIVSGLHATDADGVVTVGPGVAFDGFGRLLQAVAEIVAPPRPETATVLTISYAERTSPSVSGQVGIVTEVAQLVWHDALGAIDPLTEVVIGSGVPLSSAGRSYAGVPAGTILFHHPSVPTTATLSGWSAAPLSGVRIDADPLVIAAPTGAAGDGSLTVGSGTLGVGTLSPQAYLDVLAPSVALAGPGLLTSFDTVVRGTAATLGSTLHLGDVVTVTDRTGMTRQAGVVRITAATEFITDAALNCVDAPFTFEQALIASVQGSGAPDALTVNRAGLVGLGIATPAAALHLSKGDLEIGGQGAQLRFTGDGTIRTGDEASSIAFQTTPPQTLFDQRGEIRWLPGRALPTPPVGMTLDGLGRLGIGTAAPQAALDIAGTLRLASGGLIFPDGTIQLEAMVSVPVGAVIDWWQGTASNLPPDNFMICSGGVVSDPDSPFVGLTVPNLSDCFVYGAVDDSKAATPIGTDQHQHALATPIHVHAFPHTHPAVGGVTERAYNSDGMAGAPHNNAAAGHSHNWTGTVGQTGTQFTGANSDAGQTTLTSMASTLPPFVSLLKLIRIR